MLEANVKSEPGSPLGPSPMLVSRHFPAPVPIIPSFSQALLNVLTLSTPMLTKRQHQDLMPSTYRIKS